MRVYIVNRPCDDSYYPGHVHKVFSTLEAAEKFCDVNNPQDDHDWQYYVTEHEVLE